MDKEQAVRQALRKRFMALELRDYEMMKSVFYPKAQIIQSGRFQLQKTIEEYIQWIESLFDRIEINQYQVKDIQLFETVAVVSESYHFYYTRKSDLVNCVGYGSISSVLKNWEGQWKIIQMCVGNHTLELDTSSDVIS
ncbi:MAG: nuclear transport factor 2 family protein [Runella sp.]